MKQHIPNIATLLNLMSGCIAILFVVQGELVWGAIFVCIGIVFDFLDGLLARMLQAQSALGLQLDSLADVVTSGVVPGLIMYQLMAMSVNTSGELIYLFETNSDDVTWFNTELVFFPLIALLIPLASAYRLGKFNLDTEQQDFFKGLPTPANTLLIISLPLILEYQNNDLINAQILNPWILLGITMLSVYMLNAPIKLFSLKFKSFDFKSNATRFSFLILTLVLFIVLRYAAVPVIIVLYVIMSLLDSLADRSNESS